MNKLILYIYMIITDNRQSLVLFLLVLYIFCSNTVQIRVKGNLLLCHLLVLYRFCSDKVQISDKGQSAPLSSFGSLYILF